MAAAREKRNPLDGWLHKSDVTKLIDKIRNDHEDTVVLKIKDHIVSDLLPAVLDLIFEALKENKVCQALYAQNITAALGDDQLRKLIQILKEKQIWCLNLGENYRVTTPMWVEFCDELCETNVTHLYVSEHVIKIKLKNKMREEIR